MAATYRFPLPPEFRFIHEPLGATAAGSSERFAGREAELNNLVGRVLHSEGGAFLITGFRGVGKTTFVYQVLRRLREWHAQKDRHGKTEIVDVFLNISRPLDTLELMQIVLRGLYRRLEELGVLERLEPELRRAVELAHMRTCASVALSSSSSAETSTSLSLPASIVSELLPGVELSSTRSREQGRGLEYLAYDDRSAEYELAAIARRLRNCRRKPTLMDRLLFRTRATCALRIVFVFDEMDKLEDAKGRSTEVLESIICDLKSFFTTSGITFFFVAGKDMHYRWIDDVRTGDSVYESVFTCEQYLPLLWSSASELCSPALSTIAEEPANDAVLKNFQRYLDYRGRGIPRRVLGGLHEQVEWNGQTLSLCFSAAEARRDRFFARLLDLLDANLERFPRLKERIKDEIYDQHKLCLLYLTDWILQQGQSTFSQSEAMEFARRVQQRIAPREELGESFVAQLFEILTEHEYTETVEATRVTTRATILRVKRRRLHEMGHAQRVENEELAELDEHSLGISGYKHLQRIGQGAYCSIYKAIDERTLQPFAIKRLHATLLRDTSAVSMLRQEAAILRRLNHPGLVRLHDEEFSNETCHLVLDYVPGAPLSDLPASTTTANHELATNLVGQILSVLSYVHENDVLWRDAKPGNVMVTTEGHVVLIDFGVAMDLERTSYPWWSRAVGTPGYIAPELADGSGPDVRSDLWSVGVILYELLTGKKPYPRVTAKEWARHAETVAVLPSKLVDVAPALEEFVMRLLAKDPAERFPTARAAFEAYEFPSQIIPVEVEAPSESLLEETNMAFERSATEAPAALPRPVVPAAQKSAAEPLLPAWTPESEPAPPPPPMEVEPAALATLPARPRVDAASTASEPEISGPYLSAHVPDMPARIVKLHQSEVSIGRHGDCQVRLDDESVSRFHVRILYRDGSYWVEDLNSINGTFLNGRRLDPGSVTELTERMRLRIGRSEIEFFPGRSRTTFVVHFRRSAVKVETDGECSLLDLAYDNGVDNDSACRMGACGSCRAKLLSGEVRSDVDFDEGEIDPGTILTCVSHPISDVTLDL